MSGKFQFFQVDSSDMSSLRMFSLATQQHNAMSTLSDPNQQFTYVFSFEKTVQRLR